jgi:hypothetical protein
MQRHVPCAFLHMKSTVSKCYCLYFSCNRSGGCSQPTVARRAPHSLKMEMLSLVAHCPTIGRPEVNILNLKTTYHAIVNDLKVNSSYLQYSFDPGPAVLLSVGVQHQFLPWHLV